MRYRTEVYLKDTDALVIDLGHWESKRDAQAACMAHALEPMAWEERWSGTWQARTNIYQYRLTPAGTETKGRAPEG